VRKDNKIRFMKWLKNKIKIEGVNDDNLDKILFDFLPKRIDENKRQLMCILYYVYRYLKLK
jgi:glucan phosphorylase